MSLTAERGFSTTSFIHYSAKTATGNGHRRYDSTPTANENFRHPNRRFGPVLTNVRAASAHDVFRAESGSKKTRDTSDGLSAFRACEIFGRPAAAASTRAER